MSEEVWRLKGTDQATAARKLHEMTLAAAQSSGRKYPDEGALAMNKKGLPRVASEKVFRYRNRC
jgi:hypothetical protein